MTNLLPYAIAWAVLALVVVILGFVRKHYSANEDDSLHLGGGSDTAIEHQQSVAKKLAAVDKWGKVLTVVMVVTGVALVIIYGLRMWEASSTAGM